jgi:hypothetical protein
MLLPTNPRRPRIASNVMDESGHPFPPERSGTPRRGMFRRPDDEEPSMTTTEARLSASMRRTIEEQLEESLRSLEEQATVLMREVAAEMWRAAGADARPEQERIVSLLSRDQAIRTLIASSDERYQSLALRSARVEDTVTAVAENGRATREAIQSSLRAIREIADSPTLHGIEGIRNQLEQVEHHIAAAFATMEDRDRTIAESVTRQIEAHGRILADEAAKVIGAIDAYVQTGAEAMGNLSASVEERAAAFAVHDSTIGDLVADRVTTELAPVAEQLEMLAEKVGLHGRDQEQVRAAIERLVEARIMGVAQLVRSDSEALRSLIEERGEVQAETVRETVDWRLAAFAERIDEKLETVADAVSSRAAEAAEVAIASSLGQTVERMNAGVGAIDGIDAMVAEGQAAVEERLLAHIDDRMTSIARLIRSDNQALASAIREQQEVTPAEPLDAELVRQTLRAMKELQAGLSSQVQGGVDSQVRAITDQLHRETQSTTESMVKVAEVLGEKIDRLAVRVDEGYGNDVQIVIDRMSDAIQAMAVTRRTA